MKYIIPLLLVGFAAASPLKSFDDAFLQEHAHKFLFTPKVIANDDNSEFFAQTDLIRTIGFCLRNSAQNGVVDAGSCMAQSWRGRKTTSQLLTTFLKKNVDGVDDTVEVDLSDDATIQNDLKNEKRWTASGTLTVQGMAISYTRVGLVKFSENKITFEEDAQVKQDKLTAGAAAYIDVDYTVKKVDEGAYRIKATTSIHYAAGLSLTTGNDSFVEASLSGQNIVGIETQALFTNGSVEVETEATIIGTHISNLHDHDASGSDSHVLDSRSDDGIVLHWLLLQFNSSFASIEDGSTVVVTSDFYSGKPTFRVYSISENGKSANISGTTQKFSVRSQDTLSTGSQARDYAEQVMSDDGLDTVIDSQLDVTVGSDKSVDVKGSAIGHTTDTVTFKDGTKVIETTDTSLDAHLTFKDNGDQTESVITDATLKIKLVH